MLKKIRSALVTGGTGFIGSALVHRLSDEGVKVVCLVRPQSKGRSRIEKLDGVDLLEAKSLESSDLARDLRGISADVVFNLASAGVAPDTCTPDQILSGNLGVLMGLISATSSWNVKRFVHLGSCWEYGLVQMGRAVAETEPLRPVSIYGAAKACCHLYGTALAASKKLPFLTLRLFGAYGVGESPRRLIPYVIDHLKNDRSVDLTPGDQIRDLLYVDDAVDAILIGAENNKLSGYGCLNVCSGKGTSVRQVAETVAFRMGKPLGMLRFGARPYRTEEPPWIVGDNRLFTALTGWAPKISLEEGIQRMVDWSKRGKEADQAFGVNQSAG